MKEMVKRFLKDEEGATMVEYGLMVALIAIALIGTITLLKGGLDTVFKRANTELTNANSGTGTGG